MKNIGIASFLLLTNHFVISRFHCTVVTRLLLSESTCLGRRDSSGGFGGGRSGEEEEERSNPTANNITAKALAVVGKGDPRMERQEED